MTRRGGNRPTGLVAALTAACLSGCWLLGSGSPFLDPAFPSLDVQRLVLLPIRSQSEWPGAPALVKEALEQVLVKEKRYVLVVASLAPPLAERLLQGWLAGPPGALPDRALMTTLATAEEGHAVLGLEITAYTQSLEERPAIGHDGALYHRTLPVTTLSLNGWLWSPRTGGIIWRDERSERVYHGAGLPLPGTFDPVAQTAVRNLMRRLPARPARMPVSSPR